ncbi:hypothetical protein SH1V18_11360 [Vallitalea longa]|uniref:Uncharacterized protein n=1 Tax=Vallitalea longa TaxID=2936439 RepID=A0A9W5Y9M8_9FIRM|nr:hypothetical protein [Vallitalea longa]GKX28656.1 hypothetical protein SH1V18_11360 [Vallitalea longa]
MIYVSSLSAFGKKTFGDKSLQTNMDKIIEQLHLSPKITGMDSVVLGPKDLSISHTRTSLSNALLQKHEDILIIYLYTNEKQAKLLESNKILAKKMDNRINLANFQAVVPELLEDKDTIKKEDIVPRQKKKKIDKPVKKSESMIQKKKKKTKSANTKKENNIIEEESNPTEEPTKEELQSQILKNQSNEEKVQVPIETVTENPIEDIKFTKVKTCEERIKECLSFSDWNLLNKQLDKDYIVKDLMTESNQFAEAMSMLKSLDNDIVDIFKDEFKSSEQKFEEIRELGMKRSGVKSNWNNMITEKVMSILTAMSVSAESIINSRLREITSALDKFSTVTTVHYKQDKEQLDKLLKERLDLQFQLHELSKSLITVYQSMDTTINEVIGTFDEGLPSENAYINDVYKTSKNIFTPVNASALATKLMSDLQKNRISLSALDKNVQEIIAKVFRLCELDESIILHQNKLIKLLEANNVEDVVIVDTILKNSLRLFVGPYDVGKRATTITWAGILSRRHNTLLIDLTGNSKFRAYGIEPVTLENFLNNRIQEQFLCVEGDILSIDSKTEDVIAELKKRLNYYPFINIILDSSQTTLIKTLSEHALSITYITDCTARGNSQLENAIENVTIENIARKIVLIDPPTEEMSLLHDLHIDPLTTKLITLPHLSKMKACSLKCIAPFTDKDIVTIFEEAFR